jgi:ribosomal RNA-processing protein 1
MVEFRQFVSGRTGKMVVKEEQMLPRAKKLAKKPRIRQENEVQKAANDIFTGENTAGKEIVLTQELKLVKTLAGNDPKLRTKVLKNLRIWLHARSKSSFAFTDNDFMRLWKGLFYCMWMTDKPLPQEEMAENLGSLVDCFADVKIAVQFYRNFLATMAIEWFGIDKWRLDKFMMVGQIEHLCYFIQ